MKIHFAPQDGIDSFPDEERELLDILGHPEAFITDESGISDFILMDLTGSAYQNAKLAIWAQIEEKYPGIEVKGKNNLLDLCRTIYAYKQRPRVQ